MTNEGAKVLQEALTAVETADMDFFSVLGNKLSSFIEKMVNLTEQNKGE